MIERPARVLVIRLTALGDVVLVEPILRALRLRFPEATIDLLTEARYAGLGRALGADEVIGWDRRGADRGLRGMTRVIDRLPVHAYDLVLDLQGKPRTRVFAQRVPAKLRLTLTKRTVLRGVLAIFGADPPIDDRHATDVYASALAPLGVTLASDEDRAPKLTGITPRPRATFDLPSNRRLVGLSPGATHPTKRWSVARFAALADALHQAAPDLAFVLVGGPDDRPLLDELRARARAPISTLDVAALDVLGLAETIAALDLLVGVDSGPAHLAAALDVPTLVLFGPTSVVRWGPRSTKHRALTLGLDCAPCSNTGGPRCPRPDRRRACLDDLGEDAVLAAASALLAQRDEGPR